MTENWQSLIVAICVALAAYVLGRRLMRFVRALLRPDQASGCGGCEQCPSAQQAQTESGTPIVELRVVNRPPDRSSPGHFS